MFIYLRVGLPVFYLNFTYYIKQGLDSIYSWDARSKWIIELIITLFIMVKIVSFVIKNELPIFHFKARQDLKNCLSAFEKVKFKWFFLKLVPILQSSFDFSITLTTWVIAKLTKIKVSPPITMNFKDDKSCESLQMCSTEKVELIIISSDASRSIGSWR